MCTTAAGLSPHWFSIIDFSIAFPASDEHSTLHLSAQGQSNSIQCKDMPACGARDEGNQRSGLSRTHHSDVCLTIVSRSRARETSSTIHATSVKAGGHLQHQLLSLCYFLEVASSLAQTLALPQKGRLERSAIGSGARPWHRLKDTQATSIVQNVGKYDGAFCSSPSGRIAVCRVSWGGGVPLLCAAWAQPAICAVQVYCYAGIGTWPCHFFRNTCDYGRALCCRQRFN